MSCSQARSRWWRSIRLLLSRSIRGRILQTHRQLIKSATISFGQALLPAVIDRAMRAAGEAEVFFAIGTSLQVYPIAGTVDVASAAGAKIVILNAEPTPFDSMANAVFSAPIGTILPQLVLA